ncbi:MAG: nucleoside hydrolase [Candidatus Acetothermia bacterium]
MKTFNTKRTLWTFVILLLVAVTVIISAVTTVADGTQKPVIYIHDGAIDEYVSYLLLSTMDGMDLQGLIIVNADCIDTPAMDAQWKFQQFTGQTDVPLALSRARGWNPFPWSFRAQCIEQKNVKFLEDYKPSPVYPSGEKLLRKVLTEAVEADRPVTLLVNCPLTPLYLVLSQNPELEEGIDKLVWMGGAIDVKGNLGSPPVVPKQVANEKAEWNVFWDPSSTEWIFENTSFPIVEFPLDITNKAQITEKFLSRLKEQGKNFTYSDLAYESYSIITSLTKANQSSYEMWDVLTTTSPALISIRNTPRNISPW